MGLVRAPGLLQKVFLTSREIIKYIIIVRTFFWAQKCSMTGTSIGGNNHGGESEKPPATKYFDLLRKNNKHGFKSAAEIRGNPTMRTG